MSESRETPGRRVRQRGIYTGESYQPQRSAQARPEGRDVQPERQVQQETRSVQAGRQTRPEGRSAQQARPEGRVGQQAEQATYPEPERRIRPESRDVQPERQVQQEVRGTRTIRQVQQEPRNGQAGRQARPESQSAQQARSEGRNEARQHRLGQGLTSEISQQQKKQRRAKRERGKILLAVGIVLAVIYIAVAIYFGFHFYKGTMIYGVDCSYMTAAEAKAGVADQLDQYSLELRERGDRTETISAGQIGLTFVDNSSIDRMLKAQRCYIWPVMLLMDRAGMDSVASSYHKAMAEEALNSLSCMDDVRAVAPEDAFVRMTDTGYEVVPEVMGTTLDHERTLQALYAALDAGDTVLPLDEEGCYIDPQLYADNEELNREAEEKSKLARANITYDFGDRQEVVDVSVIDGWIVELADGTYTIDETLVADYVENLAAKYDTFGLTREFYTSIGTVVTLTGGDYGWCMDQDGTMAELMTALDEGYQGTMEPEYIYTAMSRDTNDIGYTYVEICISQQRMWCYQDGNLIVDTPVVTGNPNRGNATPSGGVWAIDAKMRDYILTGEGYTAPVDYWMPFNEDVGIHDMQTRAQFGGSIYLSNGSHGCVNTPYEQAQIIYNAVSIGTPVVVYD